MLKAYINWGAINPTSPPDIFYEAHSYWPYIIKWPQTYKEGWDAFFMVQTYVSAAHALLEYHDHFKWLNMHTYNALLKPHLQYKH